MSTFLPFSQKPNRVTAAYLLLFLFVFAVLLTTVCPSVYWLDTGEFLAALSSLGLAHSPSFPSYILLTHPFLWLPFGDIAFRGNLTSVFFGALVALAVLHLFRALSGRYDRKENQNTVLGVGMLFAGISVLNPLIWFQCLKSEVYTLNIFLVLMSLKLAINSLSDPETNHFKDWSLIVLLTSLGLCNHLLLTAHAVPALFLCVLLIIRKLKWFQISMFFLLSLFTGSIYLYLPVRSAQNPGLDLGNPEHYLTFINGITRRGSYSRFFGNRSSDILSNIPQYFEVLHQHLPYAIWIPFLIGAFLLFRSRLIILAVLGTAFGVNIFITLVNKNFNVNPDTGPAYLMLSTIILILIAGFGVLKFLQWSPSNTSRMILISSKSIVILVSLLAFAISAVQFPAKSGLNEDFSAWKIGHAALDSMKPDAIFFTGFYSNLRYVVSYLQIAEKYRDDIAIVDRGEATYWPGGLEKIVGTYSDRIQTIFSPQDQEIINFLAPRGARHSHPMPMEDAKNYILNVLARLALEFSESESIYWAPSEDDILLMGNVRPAGILLEVAPRFANKKYSKSNKLIVNQYRERLCMDQPGFKQTKGFEILTGSLVNTGNSLDNSGLTESAIELYDTALDWYPGFTAALENKKIAVERLHSNP